MEDASLFQRPEAIPEPDLLEIFGDREVTIFGISGTFNQLAGMCPIDLYDPNVSLHAKNEFVIKAANEAGLEIEAEHTAIFERVLEDSGLERKFGIIESPKESDAAAERDEDPTPAMLDRLDSRQNPPEVVEQPFRPPDEAIDNLPPLSEIEPINEALSRNVAAETIADKPVAPPRRSDESLNSIVSADIENKRNQDENTTGPVDVAETLKSEAVHETSTEKIETIETSPQTNRTEHAEWTADVIVNLSDDVAADRPSYQIDSPVIVSPVPRTELNGVRDPLAPDALPDNETVPNVELSEQIVGLGEILTKPENGIFEVFIGSLRAVEQRPFELDVRAAAEDRETESAETGTRLLAAIAERLENLPETSKSEVATKVREIVGALHGYRLLESADADQTELEDIEGKLEGLVGELLELNGLEPDADDIKTVISYLLGEDFSKALIDDLETAAVDLDNEGTHEAKHFRFLSRSFTAAEQRVQQMLGSFILLCTNTSYGR